MKKKNFTRVWGIQCIFYIYTVSTRMSKVQVNNSCCNFFSPLNGLNKRSSMKKGKIYPMIRLDENTTLTSRKMCINCDDREREREEHGFASPSLSLPFFFWWVAGGGGIWKTTITSHDQNLNWGSTSIAQVNFAKRDLLNICSKSIW